MLRYVLIAGLMWPFALAIVVNRMVERKGESAKRYSDCMKHTAEMEVVIYGTVLSLSVAWWLEDNGIRVRDPLRHRIPEHRLAKPDEPCTSSCPTDDLRGDDRVIATYCTRHGRRIPPNPGLASRKI